MNGDYSSIQDAINAADAGGSVLVPVGHYTETLVISESITLQGGWNAACTTRLTRDPSQTVVDANRAGSVMRITGESPVIEGLTLTGGWADKGGGVFIENASPTLARVIVGGNAISTTAYEPTYGGGVYASSGSLTLDHCQIISNVAYSVSGQGAMGGGLFAENPVEKVVLMGTQISHNGAAPGNTLDGGGVFTWGYTQLIFSGADGAIAFNSAFRGGGIYTRGKILGSTVLSNTADFGGGVFLDGAHGGVVANCIIGGNGASEGGGGIHAYGGGQFANNTIVGYTGDGSAGLQVEGADIAVTLTNNIIVGHEIGVSSPYETVSVTLVTNDVWDNETNYDGVLTGTTDVSVDPAFVSISAGDFHLADASQLIDAGTTVPWVTADFEGDPRPIGPAYDIGADEWGRFVFLPAIMRAPAS